MDKIDKAVEGKLLMYGYIPEDLTSEEMDRLRKECELELRGGVVFDGVLFSRAVEGRKMQRLYNQTRG